MTEIKSKFSQHKEDYWVSAESCFLRGAHKHETSEKF